MLTVIELQAQQGGGLEGPGPGDVLDGVAAPTQDDGGEVVGEGVLQAVGVACRLAKKGEGLPRFERLKSPSRSPTTESAPICITRASGWNLAMALVITCAMSQCGWGLPP